MRLSVTGERVRHLFLCFLHLLFLIRRSGGLPWSKIRFPSGSSTYKSRTRLRAAFALVARFFTSACRPVFVTLFTSLRLLFTELGSASYNTSDLLNKSTFYIEYYVIKVNVTRAQQGIPGLFLCSVAYP